MFNGLIRMSTPTSRLLSKLYSSCHTNLSKIKLQPSTSFHPIIYTRSKSIASTVTNDAIDQKYPLTHHINRFSNNDALSPIRLLQTSWNRIRIHALFTQATAILSSPTVNQVSKMKKHLRKKPEKPKRTLGQPQMKGVVLQTFTRKPKKPNSAQRKCVAVRVKNGRRVVAYVPFGGHSLQEHSVVLIQGGRVQDLPGVRYVCVRGVYDLTWNKK